MSTHERHTSEASEMGLFGILPRELFDMIVHHLTPIEGGENFDPFAPRNLCSIARTSHAMHIFHQLIYSFVPITLSKTLMFITVPRTDRDRHVTEHWRINIPETESTNAKDFIRTLQDHPDLAKQIKKLYLRREDYHWNPRFRRGFYGWDSYPRKTMTIDDWPNVDDNVCHYSDYIPNLKRETPLDTVLLREIMPLLPGLTMLDCSRYRSDSPNDPFLCDFLPQELKDTSMRHITTVSINCGLHILERTSRFFCLPALHHLTVSHVKFRPFAYRGFNPVCATLRIFDLQYCELNVDSRCGYNSGIDPDWPVGTLVEVAPGLEVLRISYVMRQMPRPRPCPRLIASEPGVFDEVVKRFESRFKEIKIEAVDIEYEEGEFNWNEHS